MEMSKISQLDHWRKRSISPTVTTPVPMKELKALNDDQPVVDEALRIYMHLLLLNQQEYSLKRLDADMNEVSDFDLYLSADVSGTTKYQTKYTVKFGWRTEQHIELMKKMSGAKTTGELISRAMFVLWSAHEHISKDGFMLMRKAGEAPQTISASDFYE